MIKSGSKGDDGPCDAIVIEIDCSDYPNGAPHFDMKSSPTTWTVNTIYRNKKKYTRAKLEDSTAKFLSNKNNVDHPVMKHVSKLIDIAPTDLINMKKNGIKKLLKNLKSSKTGKALDLHHLLPVWLGGKNDGNLVPIGDDEHDAMHEWWNKKLKGQNNQFLTDLERCTKRADSNNIKKMEAARIKKVKPHANAKRRTKSVEMNLNESNTTTLSRNLKKAGIKLQVKMTCKCTSHANKEDTA